MTSPTPIPMEAAVVTTEKVVLALQTLPPSWVTVLAALLTPAIALLAAAVAFAQWRIAKQKLQLDLFDRRYQVYTVIQRTCSQILLDGKCDTAAFGEFENAIFGSRWLFDDKVSMNLSNVFALMRRINSLTAQLHLMDPLSHSDRNQRLESDISLRKTTLTGLRDTLDGQMAPYLDLSRKSDFLPTHQRFHSFTLHKT